MKKSIFLVMNLFISFDLFAVVYKCETKEGNVLYTNDQMKSGYCKKTDIENQNKIDRGNKGETNSFYTNNSVSLLSGDKENKRLVILQKELDSEKNELKDIKVKLNNSKYSVKEVEEIKAIIKVHEQNISTLEKELGKSTNINLQPNKKEANK